jgi:hypothetical protein
MSCTEKREKIFILGVGAQKAGTTWLHRQLCGSSQFSPGFAKEYHTFDCLYSPVCGGVRKRLLAATQRSLRESTNTAPTSPRSSHGQHAKQLSFIEDPTNYFEYFDYLWLSQPNIKATGDITPSYSTLDAEAFRFIRTGLIEKGFQPRVIFLMRDPIERIWSMLRMDWRNRGITLSHEEEMNRLLASHNQRGVYLRTSYDLTITALSQAFPEEEVHYALYETLFTDAEYNKISSFTGISLPPADFETAVNASPKINNSPVSENAALSIANTYRNAYCEARRIFGSEVTHLWPGYAYIN